MTLQAIARLGTETKKFVVMFEQFAHKESLQADSYAFNLRAYIGRADPWGNIYAQPFKIILPTIFNNGTSGPYWEVWVYNDPRGAILSVHAEDRDWSLLKSSWEGLLAAMKLQGLDPQLLTRPDEELRLMRNKENCDRIELLYLLYREAFASTQRPVLIESICPSHIDGLKIAKQLIDQGWAMRKTSHPPLHYESLVYITFEGISQARQFEYDYKLKACLVIDTLRELVKDEREEKLYLPEEWRFQKSRPKYRIDWDQVEMFLDPFKSMPVEDGWLVNDEPQDDSGQTTLPFLWTVEKKRAIESHRSSVGARSDELETQDPREPQHESTSTAAVKVVEAQISQTADAEVSNINKVRNVVSMRQYYKYYSPETAKEILDNVEVAWGRYCDEGGRWGPGKFNGLVGVTPTTVGRYIKAFKRAGITCWNDIDLP